MSSFFVKIQLENLRRSNYFTIITTTINSKSFKIQEFAMICNINDSKLHLDYYDRLEILINSFSNILGNDGQYLP